MSREPLRGKPLQKGIIDVAHRLGWRVAHFPVVKTAWGTWQTQVAADGKGFPDLLLVRERIVIAEVKGDGDSLRPEQRDWHNAFRLAGVEAYVWKPRDYPDAIVEVLRTRRVGAILPSEVPDVAVG